MFLAALAICLLHTQAAVQRGIAQVADKTTRGDSMRRMVGQLAEGEPTAENAWIFIKNHKPQAPSRLLCIPQIVLWVNSRLMFNS